MIFSYKDREEIACAAWRRGELLPGQEQLQDEGLIQAVNELIGEG
jgi:hypothetical protein